MSNCFSSCQVFETLIAARGTDVFNKLTPVSGDVGDVGLGLSPEDRRKVVDEVTYVFHSAATLDFEATLKPTVNINLLGTRRVVELCKECSKLKVLLFLN